MVSLALARSLTRCQEGYLNASCRSSARSVVGWPLSLGRSTEEVPLYHAPSVLPSFLQTSDRDSEREGGGTERGSTMESAQSFSLRSAPHMCTYRDDLD